MNKLLLPVAVLAFLILPGTISAQKTLTVKKATYFDKTKPLRDRTFFPQQAREREWKNGEIRNETPERQLSGKLNPLPVGQDGLWQKTFGPQHSREPFVNFEGVGNRNSVYPPDTDGDVGPDYYFQMINLSFQIFDKQGNSLYGPADNRVLWDGFIGPWTSTNDGDPIVLYDELADRWVASQFAINTPDGTYWELVAVSATGDPLGEWYRYAFQYPVFNDYPKMGVWPDGYYFSFNMFGEDYRRVAVSAHERDKMLAGDSTARMILFDLGYGTDPWSMLPADFDGDPPPAGAPNYFIYAQDDAFYPTIDHLSLWEFKADWEDPLNSTFEEVTAMPVEPFDSQLCDAPRGRCVPQPDNSPRLESLSDRLMFRLQYRNFGTYQAMVTNHTVDVDGNGHAGIRWYEMRNMNDGAGWFLYQQGTYAPDSDNRWMGSIAMDGRGYIALGFSVSSETTYPSIRYTGRSPEAPLGQMTFFEEEIMEGTGAQTGDASRWGDYSMMSVDPSTDTTFWFTTEYVKNTGTVTWRTRVAGFNLMEDLIAPDVVTDLAASAATTNAVNLSWTASGDDGDEGTAFLYDIRYSTEPITEENFDAASIVAKTPKPKESGMQELFAVTGLEFSTKYYFALKVRDRQFNFSPVSNVVEATTPGAPEISMPENAVVQKLFPGSVGTRSWQIRNDGGSDIYYRIIKDTLSTVRRERKLGWYADTDRILDPAVDKALQEAFANSQEGSSRGMGEVLGSFSNTSYAVSGLAWINGMLYMCDMQSAKLAIYDTASQTVVTTVPIHTFPYGMAWDDEYLWIGDKFGNVYAYNTDGSPAGYSFSCPLAGNNSLAWDGTCFLVNFILENDPRIYRVDETGDIIEKYTTDLGNRSIWQSVWVPEHYTGNFWFTNNNGIIAQLKLDNGVLTLVNEFDAPFNVSYAITHDHKDLWYGKVGGTVFQVDDGMDEVSWLTVSPDKSTIPGPSVSDLSLTFDASKFDLGNYHANMVISSNDPDNPVVRIPVDLLVTTPPELGPDTSFCGHLDITLDAGDGFAGYLWSDGSTEQVHSIDSTFYGLGSASVWVDVTDLGGTVKRDSISVTFLDCSSIFEFSSGLKVTVYPNPNRGTFSIEATGTREKIEIDLTDLAGRSVLQREMASPGKELIELGANPKGQYLLRLRAGEGMRVQRVVVY
jgi:hypothetical protein